MQQIARRRNAVSGALCFLNINDVQSEGEKIMTKTVSVEGMMCQHCVKHVHDALVKVPGVSSADVSLEEKKARVECEASVSDDALKAAVVDAGYEVTGIEG